MRFLNFLPQEIIICLNYLFIWLSRVLVVACRPRCYIACGILVPQPGTKPMSPALQGEFLTTGPPGKSLDMKL